MPVVDGQYEIDQFDDTDTIYLIVADEDGGHAASIRLFPSTRPHMLDTLFPHLCPLGVPVDEATWESKRLCLPQRHGAKRRRELRNMLFSAMVDVALDRGTSGNAQPDRRTPGEVLDTMRRSVHGVHQLAQALRDFDDDVAIRAVDEQGEPRRLANGSADQTVSDIFLRSEFPPPGKAKAARPGDTPNDRYDAAIEVLAGAFHELDEAFDGLARVKGDDDHPLVESRSVELRLTDAWRELLSRVGDEVVVWARTYRKTFGAAPNPVEFSADDDEADEDPYADSGDDDLEEEARA